MKKLFFLSLVSFFVQFNIFSEQAFLIDENNIFGGRTILRTYDQSEQAEYSYSQITEYYDSGNMIVQIVIIPTTEFTAIGGLLQQTQHYRDNQLLGYEKLFSEQTRERRDFNRTIEEVDHTGQIISTRWYYNDMLLDISREATDSFEYYYTRKIRVYSNGNPYWFFVQTTIEEFVKGQKATIMYYLIGFNGELFLIGIGFYDIVE